jgi:hypothetical protein
MADTSSVISEQGYRFGVDESELKELKMKLRKDLQELALTYNSVQSTKSMLKILEGRVENANLSQGRLEAGARKISTEEYGLLLFSQLSKLIYEHSPPLPSIMEIIMKTNINIDIFIGEMSSIAATERTTLKSLAIEGLIARIGPLGKEPEREEYNLQCKILKSNMKQAESIQAYKNWQSSKPTDVKLDTSKLGPNDLVEERKDAIHFITSNHHNLLTLILEKKAEALDLEWAGEHSSDNKKYIMRKEEYDKVEKQYATAEKESHQEIILNLGPVITKFMADIVNAVKKALPESKDFTNPIRNKLNKTIRFGNKEGIAPWDIGNLPGMYSILQVQYGTPKIANFINMLTALIDETTSEGEILKDPYNGLEKLESHLQSWRKINMGSMLTMDMLFVVKLLDQHKGVPRFRFKIINALYEYLRTNDIMINPLEDSSDIASRQATPVFEWLGEYIREQIEQNESHGDSIDELLGVKRNSDSKHSKKDETKRKVTTFAGTETAASSEITNNKTLKAITANFKSEEIIPRKDAYNDNFGIRIKSKKTGRMMWFIYTATTEECSKCKSKDPNLMHDPRCYPFQCSSCKLYGHKPEVCRQGDSNSSMGKATTPSTPGVGVASP